jgi:hypothetical protein
MLDTLPGELITRGATGSELDCARGDRRDARVMLSLSQHQLPAEMRDDGDEKQWVARRIYQNLHSNRLYFYYYSRVGSVKLPVKTWLLVSGLSRHQAKNMSSMIRTWPSR